MWFNYDKEEFEFRDRAPGDFTQYLPKGAARNLYTLYKAEGQSPLEAAKNVLSICVGKELEIEKIQD